MNNKKYYDHVKKSQSQSSQMSSRRFVQGLYVEMLLNEIVLKREKQFLLREIDKALDEKDEGQFKLLTKQLLQLNEKFGL